MVPWVVIGSFAVVMGPDLRVRGTAPRTPAISLRTSAAATSEARIRSVRSVHRPAAVDEEVLAGDVARRVTGQEHDRAVELVDAPWSAENSSSVVSSAGALAAVPALLTST